MAKGNYLKTYRYVMGKVSQNLESGIGKQVLRFLLPCFLSASPQAFHSLSLSGCRPLLLLGMYSSTIVLASHSIHHTQTGGPISKTETLPGSTYFKCFLQPHFLLGGCVTELQPRVKTGYIKGGHDPIRKGRAKAKRLFRKEMECRVCAELYEDKMEIVLKGLTKF